MGSIGEHRLLTGGVPEREPARAGTDGGHRPAGADGGSATPDYVAGVCNIGPAEVAARRRAASAATAGTAALALGLVLLGAPRSICALVGVPIEVGA